MNQDKEELIIKKRLLESAQLAYQKFISKEFEDVAYMEPFYLKEFTISKNKKKILG